MAVCRAIATKVSRPFFLTFASQLFASLGERQSIAQKGVRAIDARNSWLEHDSNAAKTSVRAPGLTTSEREHPFWADPGVLWKKAARAMRAMRGKTLETVQFQPYFECTKSLLKVLSSEYCQAPRAMRAKRVVTVPLQPYFRFH